MDNIVFGQKSVHEFDSKEELKYANTRLGLVLAGQFIFRNALRFVMLTPLPRRQAEHHAYASFINVVYGQKGMSECSCLCLVD